MFFNEIYETKFIFINAINVFTLSTIDDNLIKAFNDLKRLDSFSCLIETFINYYNFFFDYKIIFSIKSNEKTSRDLFNN